MASSDTKHIFQSLAVNVTIALAKGAAAVFTGSGAMLAETLHSAADCTNQLLLLLGVRRAAKAPDELHPLGYGRALYFYSFIVALLLFSGGGLFSIYEGVKKLVHPEPVERVGLGLAILFFSLALEGWATWGNLKEMKARRGKTPLLRYLRETKDSGLVVVFGENSAAVLGLVFALVALLLASVTGDPRWDAAGSLVIGLVLIGMAVFLGFEVKSLLLGERADPAIEAAVQEVLAQQQPKVVALLRLITMQQGPGEVLVAMKVRFSPGLSCAEVVAAINTFERALKARRPEIRWCFVEPDEHA
ncbi:MAG: cation diffusion facilitator family transporter [Myxococcales bacterium]|nr:cation diffusion facilitator family transporter [Myxococcales bacterium]